MPKRSNPRASKLTAPQVLEIRKKGASGKYTQGDLSREYGVSINTISNILNGVVWQHLLSQKEDNK